MKIQLSTHAKYRSLERGVSIDTIKRVIGNPSKISNQAEGQIRVEGEVDGRNIIVVYIKNKTNFVIITVI